MASVAAPFTVKVLPALLSIPGDDVENRVRAAIDGGLLARAQECGDILNLFSRQMKSRHAFAGPPLQDHGPDLIAAFVVKCQRGTHQIRPSVAPLRVGAMAKAAVGGENLLSALHRRGIRNGTANQEFVNRPCRRGRLDGGLPGK